MGTTRPSQLPEEILDTLPPDKPEAIASRQDLRRLNALLGNRGWIARTVRRHIRPGERVLELGAGDGDLALAMLQAGLPWDGLDRIDRPAMWSTEARWYQADALEFEPEAHHQVIVANLFLHHFGSEDLLVLGKWIQARARVLVVSDLWRAAWLERLFPVLCRLIGAHAVTRHDGLLSIQAGFRGEELPVALGLNSHLWHWRTTRHWNGAYRLVARKRE